MLNNNTHALIKKLSEKQKASFIIEREPSNYELFFELYKKVGYIPSNVDYETWENNTEKVWEIQDNLLPYNCTGGFYRGKLVSSLGTLPISQNVVYGHSFCMLKSLPGILTMIPQMVYSACMVERMPDTGYYAGSYKNASRFTSKLHAVSDSTGQVIIQSLDLSPSNKINNLTPDEYNLCELEENHELPKSVSVLLNLFSSAHESLKSVHKIKHYIISTKEGVPKAITIYHSSLPGFTAIDIFDRSWIIMLDNSDGVSLCEFLRTLPEFKHQTFELLNSDYGSIPQYSGLDVVTPRQWVFTPKASVKQALPILLQTVYSLIDKFPENEVIKVCEELLREKLSEADSNKASLNTFFKPESTEGSLSSKASIKAKL